jgi:hypothetical protein
MVSLASRPELLYCNTFLPVAGARLGNGGRWLLFMIDLLNRCCARENRVSISTSSLSGCAGGWFNLSQLLSWDVEDHFYIFIFSIRNDHLWGSVPTTHWY